MRAMGTGFTLLTGAGAPGGGTRFWFGLSLAPPDAETLPQRGCFCGALQPACGACSHAVPALS